MKGGGHEDDIALIRKFLVPIPADLIQGNEGQKYQTTALSKFLDGIVPRDADIRNFAIILGAYPITPELVGRLQTTLTEIGKAEIRRAGTTHGQVFLLSLAQRFQSELAEILPVVIANPPARRANVDWLPSLQTLHRISKDYAISKALAKSSEINANFTRVDEASRRDISENRKDKAQEKLLQSIEKFSGGIFSKWFGLVKGLVDVPSQFRTQTVSQIWELIPPGLSADAIRELHIIFDKHTAFLAEKVLDVPLASPLDAPSGKPVRPERRVPPTPGEAAAVLAPPPPPSAPGTHVLRGELQAEPKELPPQQSPAEPEPGLESVKRGALLGLSEKPPLSARVEGNVPVHEPLPNPQLTSPGAAPSARRGNRDNRTASGLPGPTPSPPILPIARSEPAPTSEPAPALASPPGQPRFSSEYTSGPLPGDSKVERGALLGLSEKPPLSARVEGNVPVLAPLPNPQLTSPDADPSARVPVKEPGLFDSLLSTFLSTPAPASELGATPALASPPGQPRFSSEYTSGPLPGDSKVERGALLGLSEKPPLPARVEGNVPVLAPLPNPQLTSPDADPSVRRMLNIQQGSTGLTVQPGLNPPRLLSANQPVKPVEAPGSNTERPGKKTPAVAPPTGDLSKVFKKGDRLRPTGIITDPSTGQSVILTVVGDYNADTQSIEVAYGGQTLSVPVQELSQQFKVIRQPVQKRLYKKGDRVLIKNPRNIADYPAALRAEVQQTTCNDPFYATVEYDQEATTNYVKIVCDKGGRYLAEYNDLIYIPPGPARLTRTPGEAPPQPTPVAALADNATPLRRGDQPTRAPPSALGAPATTTECDRKLIGMTDRAETCEENLMKVKAELEAALAAHAAETAKLQGDLGVSQQALRRLDGVKAGLESDLVKTNRALDLIRNMLGEQTRKLGTLNTRYETLDEQKINLEGQLASERGKSAELSGDLVAERGTNAGLQAEARAAEAARAEADARATAAEAARLDAAARAAADERARAEAARAEAEARAAAEAAARLGAAAAAGYQAAALAEVRAAGEARAAAAEARAAAAAEAARAAAKARAEAEAAARAAEAARAEAAARATAAEARAEAEARAAADERARAGAAAAARAAAAAAAARAEGELAGLSEQLAAVTSERDDVTQKRRLLSEEIDRQRVELEVLQKKAADLEAQFASTKALIIQKSDEIRRDLQAGVAHIDGGLQTIRRGVNDVSGLVSEANKQIGESRADFVKKMDALQRELEAANLQGRKEVLANIVALRAENHQALGALNNSLANAMTETARLNGLLITETAAKAQAQGALQAAEAAAQAAAAARAQELADAKEASDIAFTKFREASERGNKAEIDAILAAGRENMEKLRRTLLEQQAIAVARADEAARGDLGRQLAALQAQITALPPPYVPPTPLPPQPFPIIRGRTPAGEVAVGSNINIQWEPRGTVGPWILKIFYDGVNPDFKDIQAEGNIAYTVKQPGALTGQIFSIV